MRHKRKPIPRWWLWLGLWTVLGLTIRLITVYSDPGKVAGGDAYFYHYAANLLVAGHGFLNPYYYYPHGAHREVQSASFPPLFIWLVAIPSAVGLKTFLVERVWCCILGAAAIVVVGYTGREIGGRRVGLIAAFLLAVYPNIWMSDQLALSESIAPLLVAGVLLFSYRFWKDPSVKRAIWLGLSLGIAMLGRDELTALVVFLVVPLVLLAKTLSWKRRFAVLGITLLATGLVVAPWVGYNMSRFQKPVFISTGLGVTLASSDCAQTYSGSQEGYWSMKCALKYASEPSVNTHADESVEGAELQHLALNYVRAHENRLIPVTLAKVGRAFGFFHPFEQIELDTYIETRPYHWALVGLGMYYVLFALSLGAAVILRRRRIPQFPLWAIGLVVVCSCALTFGQTRYRTTFEVSLVLMASVTLEWFWSKLRPGRDDRDTPTPTQTPRPTPTPTPESDGRPSASGSGSGEPDGELAVSGAAGSGSGTG
jgi:4-amino-4-deoxy-L-arabinose transferase-like glycosyltransferase